MVFKKQVVICLLLASGYLGGCAPYTAIRGNFVETEAMEGIQPGSTSKQDVISRLGSPTNKDPFNENCWYFIGEKTESFSFLSPDVMDKKIVEIIFGPNDLVLSIQLVDAQHDFSIKPKRRKTKTLGKDPNLIQQLLGNFGKFSRQEKEK